MWAACAARCSHGFIVGGNGGAGCESRHRSRAAARRKIVTPVHLCHEKYLSFCGESGRSTVYKPKAMLAMMSTASIQWKAIAAGV